jgi:hypothetical protein
LDPVLLPTLFDVLDIMVGRSSPTTLRDLNLYRPISPRRLSEIGRVLDAFGVAHRKGLALTPGARLPRFVECWEGADLGCLNGFFRLYEPYDRFVRLLRHERKIEIPARGDSEAKRRLGAQLKAKAALTFVAIDTFKWWGLGVGHLYISYLGDSNLYWGGNDPASDVFEESLIRLYSVIKPADGFVNVGFLADRVCRELNVSFIRFEKLLVALCREKPDKYVTSTSLAREPSSRCTVQTILPRSRAKQSSLQGTPGGAVVWTERRLVEDGVSVGGKSVKMVRIEQEDVK